MFTNKGLERMEELYRPLNDKFREEIVSYAQTYIIDPWTGEGLSFVPEFLIERALYFRWLAHSILN